MNKRKWVARSKHLKRLRKLEAKRKAVKVSTGKK